MLKLSHNRKKRKNIHPSSQPANEPPHNSKDRKKLKPIFGVLRLLIKKTKTYRLL